MLSQDEARLPMVPTLQATLGVKGHRPLVGTRDGKDVLYVFAVLNLISGLLHSNTLESLQSANRKSGESKTRRMPRASRTTCGTSAGCTRESRSAEWCC